MTVKGIEVAGTIYDNEDETARTTATEAASTARTASETATQASETATTASQTAATASQTATQADAKATINATAISELQSDVETLNSEVLKKSDLTSTVTQGSTAPITSGGVFSAIDSKLNTLKGSTSVNTGVTVTLEVPSPNFFLLVGGWNTAGRSYRALYYISTEPRNKTVVVKAISAELGETVFNGTVTGTSSDNVITLSITASQYENIASIVRAFY